MLTSHYSIQAAPEARPGPSLLLSDPGCPAQACVRTVCVCFKALQAPSKLTDFAKMICSFIHFPVELWAMVFLAVNCLLAWTFWPLITLHMSVTAVHWHHSGALGLWIPVIMSLVSSCLLCAPPTWPVWMCDVSWCLVCSQVSVTVCYRQCLPTAGWGYNLPAGNIVILLARPSARSMLGCQLATCFSIRAGHVGLSVGSHP